MWAALRSGRSISLIDLGPTRPVGTSEPNESERHQRESMRPRACRLAEGQLEGRLAKGKGKGKRKGAEKVKHLHYLRELYLDQDERTDNGLHHWRRAIN